MLMLYDSVFRYYCCTKLILQCFMLHFINLQYFLLRYLMLHYVNTALFYVALLMY